MQILKAKELLSVSIVQQSVVSPVYSSLLPLPKVTSFLVFSLNMAVSISIVRYQLFPTSLHLCFRYRCDLSPEDSEMLFLTQKQFHLRKILLLFETNMLVEFNVVVFLLLSFFSFLAPKSVVNLTEVDVFPDSSYIEVQWYQPCCNVTGYEIDCSSGDPSIGPLLEDGGENIGTCINVTAGDNITVTVTSIIEIDDSDIVRGADEQVIVTAYPNIVEDLRVHSRTSSSVLVQWDNPGGVVEEYKISCSGTATASPTSIPGNATLLKATCSDVPAGGEVMVTVNTTSGEKENPESITVEALPGKVEDLGESSATTDSVTVNWTLPADDVNRTYQYEADSSEDNVECSVLESDTEAECTNVTPGRLIYVTVTTVNGNLNNSASTPAQALPLAVSNFTEGDLTARNVSFSWEKPRGDVDQYIVSCSHGNANPDLVLEEGDSLGSTCEDLEGEKQ